VRRNSDSWGSGDREAVRLALTVSRILAGQGSNERARKLTRPYRATATGGLSLTTTVLTLGDAALRPCAREVDQRVSRFGSLALAGPLHRFRGADLLIHDVGLPDGAVLRSLAHHGLPCVRALPTDRVST
jgi:hypothetical protein